MSMKAENEEKIYRTYITDALQTAVDNIAHIGGGNCLKVRYYDLINKKPIETRTADEIIDTFITALGDEEKEGDEL